MSPTNTQSVVEELFEEKTETSREDKAIALAEDLVMSAGDEDATTDQEVSIIFGKPAKGMFFRVHPTVRADVRILKIKTGAGAQEERYIVAKSVAKHLDYVQTTTVFLGAHSDGTNFLWPIGTGSDNWSVSARRIATDAMKTWVRLVPQMSAGSYKMRVAVNLEQEPDWKDYAERPFHELLTMALDEAHLITNMEHPIAQQMANGQ